MFHMDIHQSISQVRLSHNKIVSILSESFLSFPAINLDLSYNSIQVVERQAFSIYPGSSMATDETSSSSQRSDASSSSSESPNDSSASPQTSTQLPFASTSRQGLNLYLNRNRLTMMKPNALSLEKFALVDLSYNQLVAFNFDTFARQTVLGGLNVSHNSIERIVVPKGRRFVLKFFDLSHNRIQYRGGTGQMMSVCPVDLLDFSYNRLERTDSRLFPTNCSLRVRYNHFIIIINSVIIGMIASSTCCYTHF